MPSKGRKGRAVHFLKLDSCDDEKDHGSGGEEEEEEKKKEANKKRKAQMILAAGAQALLKGLQIQRLNETIPFILE